MAEPKTRPTGVSVATYIKTIPDPALRNDASTLSAILSETTGLPAEMWGTSIIGFGRMPYAGSNGKMIDWPTMGFSPRSTGLVIYMMGGLASQPTILKKLGKARIKGGCLHIRKLSDIDLPTLKRSLASALKAKQAAHAE